MHLLIFHHPQGNLELAATPHVSPPPAPGSEQSVSVSMDLLVVDESCKWNPLTRSLVCRLFH